MKTIRFNDDIVLQVRVYDLDDFDQKKFEIKLKEKRFSFKKHKYKDGALYRISCDLSNASSLYRLIKSN